MYDSNLCESINSWSYCGGKWETWNAKLSRTDYLPSKEAVLASEGIRVEDYKYFEAFLKKRRLWTITQVYSCTSCVDLEAGVNGLRYSANKSLYLIKNDEYLIVDRLADNWFAYTRDWN